MDRITSMVDFFKNKKEFIKEIIKGGIFYQNIDIFHFENKTKQLDFFKTLVICSVLMILFISHLSLVVKYQSLEKEIIQKKIEIKRIEPKKELKNELESFYESGIIPKEYFDFKTVQEFKSKKIHPEIFNLEKEILVELRQEYWTETIKKIGGNPVVVEKLLLSVIMAIAQNESGHLCDENELPSQIKGCSWGMFQIDSFGKKVRPISVKVKGKITYFELKTTRDEKTDERFDKYKSLKFVSLYFCHLVNEFDFNIPKAIQAYNFGETGVKLLVKKYGENWYKNLEEIRVILNKPKFGDPDYLSRILTQIK